MQILKRLTVDFDCEEVGEATCTENGRQGTRAISNLGMDHNSNRQVNGENAMVLATAGNGTKFPRQMLL